MSPVAPLQGRASTASGDGYWLVASDGAVEVDKDCQLLFVVSGGQVRWVFNTSTGWVHGARPVAP